MSPPQEIVEASTVKAEVVGYMGNVLAEAQSIALAVKDDASADLAANLGVAIKIKLTWLKERRKEVYEPLYRATEDVRLEYDDPIELGVQLEKTLSAAIIKYRLEKKREEERLRLSAEAEARRIREKAARKEREVEAERQRIIREQEERERKYLADLAAEERRKQAEAKARADAERARLQREQDERAQHMKEEEDARLAKAQEAQDVGMPERVDGILERPTAIPPVVKALPTKAKLDAEDVRRKLAKAEERESERKQQEAAAEEQRIRDAESERMRKLLEDAEKAKTDAALAEASVAAQATVTQADSRMRTRTTTKYTIIDKASFLKLARAVADGRAPVEFLDFDPDCPEKFRAPAIGKHAAKIKDDPNFAAKQAELLAIGITTWLEESGGFKIDYMLKNGKFMEME